MESHLRESFVRPSSNIGGIAVDPELVAQINNIPPNAKAEGFADDFVDAGSFVTPVSEVVDPTPVAAVAEGSLRTIAGIEPGAHEAIAQASYRENLGTYVVAHPEDPNGPVRVTVHTPSGPRVLETYYPKGLSDELRVYGYLGIGVYHEGAVPEVPQYDQSFGYTHGNEEASPVEYRLPAPVAPEAQETTQLPSTVTDTMAATAVGATIQPYATSRRESHDGSGAISGTLELGLSSAVPADALIDQTPTVSLAESAAIGYALARVDEYAFAKRLTRPEYRAWTSVRAQLDSGLAKGFSDAESRVLRKALTSVINDSGWGNSHKMIRNIGKAGYEVTQRELDRYHDDVQGAMRILHDSALLVPEVSVMDKAKAALRTVKGMARVNAYSVARALENAKNSLKTSEVYVGIRAAIKNQRAKRLAKSHRKLFAAT